MPQGKNPYEHNSAQGPYHSAQGRNDMPGNTAARSAVITAKLPDEKPKTAVALEYDPEDSAPKITASGRGVLAEKIIDAAKEHQIPVHKDERLANTLSRLEVGDFIPPELYEVVAEVLMFVDRMDHIKEKIATAERPRGRK